MNNNRHVLLFDGEHDLVYRDALKQFDVERLQLILDRLAAL